VAAPAVLAMAALELVPLQLARWMMVAWPAAPMQPALVPTLPPESAAPSQLANCAAVVAPVATAVDALASTLLHLVLEPTAPSRLASGTAVAPGVPVVPALASVCTMTVPVPAMSQATLEASAQPANCTAISAPAVAAVALTTLHVMFESTAPSLPAVAAPASTLLHTVLEPAVSSQLPICTAVAVPVAPAALAPALPHMALGPVAPSQRAGCPAGVAAAALVPMLLRTTPKLAAPSQLTNCMAVAALTVLAAAALTPTLTHMAPDPAASS